MTPMADPLEAFSRLWAKGQRPDLGAFVREVGPVSAELLAALVRLDQLKRWETPIAPEDPYATNKYSPPVGVPVEAYFEQFPELQADSGLAADLILNEFSIREEQGQHPQTQEYLARFPKYATALQRQIEQHRARPNADTAGGKTLAGRPAPLPETFGRYRILKTLGEGGMGKVYLAEDTQLQRSVALKVPHFDGNDGPIVIERFYREARIAAAFHHPNLCPVYDVGSIDGTHYLTMPFLSGEPLSDYLKRMGPLPQASACRLTARIAQAIHVAHQAGVLHRDLKPANIMLPAAQTSGEPEPVVMDFGLARRGGTDPQLTSAGAMMGTGAYMPPEQIVGDSTLIGPPADVYSLGGILFQMLTGRTPFTGPLHEVLRAALSKAPPPLRNYRPDIDPALEAMCLKALAKEPAERFASMADFATALTPFCPGAPVANLPKPVPTPRPVKKKPPVLFFVGFLMAVALSGLILWAVIPLLSGPEPEPTVPRPADPIAKAGNKTERKSETKPEVKPETKPELKPEVKAEVKPELKPEAKPEVKPETKPEPPPLPKPEVKPETKLNLTDTVALKGHTAPIRTLAFNPRNGNQLASGSDDGTIRLWDLSADKHRILKGNPGVVQALAFSPDGKQLVSAGGDSKNLVFDVILWDVPSGDILVKFNGHFAPVTGAAFSPDGKTVATCATDNTIRLWDVGNRMPKEIKRLQGDQSFNAVAYHPEFEILASASDDETVRVWTLETGKFISLKGHKRPVLTTAISADGSMVASGSSVNYQVKVWGVNDGDNYGTFLGHKGAVHSVAFVRDGEMISGGADGAVIVWAIGAGNSSATYEQHTGEIYAVAASANGHWIASGGKDQTIILRQINGPKK